MIKNEERDGRVAFYLYRHSYKRCKLAKSSKIKGILFKVKLEKMKNRSSI